MRNDFYNFDIITQKSLEWCIDEHRGTGKTTELLDRVKPGDVVVFPDNGTRKQFCLMLLEHSYPYILLTNNKNVLRFEDYSLVLANPADSFIDIYRSIIDDIRGKRINNIYFSDDFIHQHIIHHNKKTFSDLTAMTGEIKKIYGMLPPSEKHDFLEFTVYWDMDGVLTDIKTSFKEFSGEEYKKWDNSKSLEYNELIFNSDFFLNIKPNPELELIKKHIKKYSEVGVRNEILTSLGGPGNKYKSKTIAHKRKWLEKHGLFGAGICNVNYTPNCSDKQFYANKNSILVDDKKENCYQFSKNGGYTQYFVDIDNTEYYLLILKNHLVKIKVLGQDI